MPCYTITTVTLEFKNANMELLKKAIKASLGIDAEIYNLGVKWNGGYYNKIMGEITLNKKTAEDDIKLIKRAYSAEIVKDQAKRFGWNLKQTSEFKYEISKR
jgi:hypothetical protein